VVLDRSVSAASSQISRAFALQIAFFFALPVSPTLFFLRDAGVFLLPSKYISFQPVFGSVCDAPSLPFEEFATAVPDPQLA